MRVSGVEFMRDEHGKRPRVGGSNKKVASLCDWTGEQKFGSSARHTPWRSDGSRRVLVYSEAVNHLHEALVDIDQILLAEEQLALLLDEDGVPLLLAHFQFVLFLERLGEEPCGFLDQLVIHLDLRAAEQLVEVELKKVFFGFTNNECECHTNRTMQQPCQQSAPITNTKDYLKDLRSLTQTADFGRVANPCEMLGDLRPITSNLLESPTVYWI